MRLLDKIRDGYRDASRLFSDEDAELAQQFHDGEKLTGAYNIGVQLATWRSRGKSRQLKKDNAEAWRDYTDEFSFIMGGLLPLSREVGFACRMQGARGSFIPGSRPEEATLESEVDSPETAAPVESPAPKESAREPLKPSAEPALPKGSIYKQPEGMSMEEWLYRAAMTSYWSPGRREMVKTKSDGDLDLVENEEMISSQFYNWMTDSWNTRYNAVDTETGHVRFVGVRDNPLEDNFASLREREKAKRKAERAGKNGWFRSIFNMDWWPRRLPGEEIEAKRGPLKYFGGLAEGFKRGYHHNRAKPIRYSMAT